MSEKQRKRRNDRRKRAARIAAGTGAGATAALAMAGPALAQDFTVTTLGPDGAPGSLRAAVDASQLSPGADRVLFQSGLTGTIELTEGVMTVQEDLEIVGPGAEKIAVDGDSYDSIVSFYGETETPLTANISGLTLQNAYGLFGGAIISGNTDLTVENSVITGNRTYYAGAAIYAGLAGSLTVRNTTVSKNVSGTGGGIFVGNQDVSIEGSTFDRNHATEFGGALVATYGDVSHTVKVENSTFTRNTGGLAGGAIAPLLAVGQRGYAEVVNPDLEIRSSTISGNQAIAAGGGVSGGFASATIDNSIISGNSAFYGPDLYSGSFGGPGPVFRAPDDCDCYDDTIFDTGFSLVEDPSQAEINETVAGSNILNQDPGLRSIADNGGPTKTLAVDPDSPVVNKGSSPLTADQRGDVRPVLYEGIANSTAAGANGADMGAFELPNVVPPPPPPPPPPVPTVKNGPFKILDSTPNPKNGTATVKVQVPAPGVVKLVGYKRLKTVTKRASAKGIFTFKATPKGNLKQNLKKKGRARVLVKFNYNPDSGRTVDKAKLFPFYKGAKSKKAAVAAVREWRRLAPWAGR